MTLEEKAAFDEEKRAIRNARDRERRRQRNMVAQAVGTYRPARNARPPKNIDGTPVVDGTDYLAVVSVEDLPEEVRTSKDKRAIYLAFLAKGMRRTQAAEKTGVSYSSVRYWRQTDAAFREQEVHVQEQLLDDIEDVVMQMAKSRDLRAAIKILEQQRPEVWAPKSKVEHQHTLQFAGSLEERLERIATLMESNKPRELEPVIWDAEVVEDPTDR